MYLRPAVLTAAVSILSTMKSNVRDSAVPTATYTKAIIEPSLSSVATQDTLTEISSLTTAGTFYGVVKGNTVDEMNKGIKYTSKKEASKNSKMRKIIAKSIGFGSIALALTMLQYPFYSGATLCYKKFGLYVLNWKLSREIEDQKLGRIGCMIVSYAIGAFVLGFLAIPMLLYTIILGGVVLFLRKIGVLDPLEENETPRANAGNNIERRVVTRSEIDRYIPNFNSDLAKNFNYTNPGTSFTKFIKLKDIELLQKNDEILFQDSTPAREETCCICIDGFTDRDNLILFPCGHFFHVGCVMNYRTAKISQVGILEELKSFKCTLCQMRLINHYLFFKENNLDPSVVPFNNKG
jgi:hypothetical protein